LKTQDKDGKKKVPEEKKIIHIVMTIIKNKTKMMKKLLQKNKKILWK